MQSQNQRSQTANVSLQIINTLVNVVKALVNVLLQTIEALVEAFLRELYTLLNHIWIVMFFCVAGNMLAERVSHGTEGSRKSFSQRHLVA